MFDKVVAEVVHENQAQDDVVLEGDVEKLSVEEAITNLVEQRKAEHPEWYGELKPTSEPEELQTEEKPEVTAADSAKSARSRSQKEQKENKEEQSEPESAVLKRVLEREAKLRQEADDFKKQKAEFESKLQAYEKDKSLAKLDPISFIKSLGFSQEDLTNVAKELYYEALGDLAPDDYQGQKEVKQLKRVVAELNAKLEAKDKVEPEEVEEVPEFVLMYQQELVESAKSVDPNQFPIVARALDKYSELDVAADMYRVATEYAQEKGGKGRALSPDECLARIEKLYAENSEKLGLQEDEPQVKKAAPKKQTKVLTNNLNKQAPQAKTLNPEMSYEEVTRIARERFTNAIKGGD